MIRAAALLAAVALAAPAQAQLNAIFEPLPGDLSPRAISAAPNLRFVLLPGPKGNTVIAWGGIGQGDAVRLGAALAAAKPVMEVQFNSPGGLLEEGMNIGRLIRKNSLATRIVSGTFCMSACNFAFMGGVVRTVEPGAKFGVHMFRDQSAQLLVGDLRSPPRSVDEWNDRFPNRPLRSYQVEDQLAKLNSGRPAAAPEPAGARNADPLLVEDPLAKENKPRPMVPTIRDPASGPQAAAPLTVADFFRHPDIQESMIDNRVRDIQQDAAQTAAVIAWFLVEMRLSLSFLTRFAAVPSSTIRVLTAQELKDMNIVN
jgi:hypothetical protein